MTKDTRVRGTNYWAIKEAATIMCERKLFRMYSIERDRSGLTWTAVMIPNRILGYDLE
jgi:hypothetical protein